MIPALDVRAVAVGAAAGLVLALPAGLVGAVVVSDDDSNLVFVFFTFILVGVLAAGYVGGSKRPDAPLAHAAAAGFATYLVAQLVAVLVDAAKGDDLQPAAYVFNALMMASVATVGGLLSTRVRAR